MIDIHCHILPGLDDGAQNLDDSLAMAVAAKDEGIRKIIVTPHMFRDEYNLGDFNIIDLKKKELEEYLTKNNVDIELYPGAEVHISHNLLDQVKKNRNKLVLNNSSYLLIEFPSDHIFSGVKDIFFEILSEGITPIIAHPERNRVFMRHHEMLYELIQQGSLAQANSGSFLGLYGMTVQRKAIEFLRMNMLHFIASDAHSVKSFKPGLSEVVKLLSRELGQKRAFALVESNPQAVLNNGTLPYLPDPIDPLSRKKSYKIKIPSFMRRSK